MGQMAVWDKRLTEARGGITSGLVKLSLKEDK